jgi:hypothetical protein
LNGRRKTGGRHSSRQREYACGRRRISGSLASLLFLWGGVDQIHFALGSGEGNPSALRDAARMNPYDAMLQARASGLPANSF